MSAAVYTAAEVGALLGVSRWAVTDRRKRGEIPAAAVLHFGQRVVYRRAVIDAWLAGQPVGGEAA